MNYIKLHHTYAYTHKYIEKSPGDLRRFPVFQAAVKDHQLTLTWKTLKE